MSAGPSSTSRVGGSRTADIERDPERAAAAAYPASARPDRRITSAQERGGLGAATSYLTLPSAPSQSSRNAPDRMGRRGAGLSRMRANTAWGIAPMCRSRTRALEAHGRNAVREREGCLAQGVAVQAPFLATRSFATRCPFRPAYRAVESRLAHPRSAVRPAWSARAAMSDFTRPRTRAVWPSKAWDKRRLRTQNRRVRGPALVTRCSMSWRASYRCR